MSCVRGALFDWGGETEEKKTAKERTAIVEEFLVVAYIK